VWPPVCVADESECVGDGGCDVGYYYCEWFRQCIPNLLPCGGGFPIPGLPEPGR
jgi:hypothetical protein